VEAPTSATTRSVLIACLLSSAVSLSLPAWTQSVGDVSTRDAPPGLAAAAGGGQKAASEDLRGRMPPG
jgi:hypothetical protein